VVQYNLADLHTHSFCSDGLRTPTQAVEEAAAAGVRVLSLTDHDTVEGVPEVLRAGEAHGIEIVPGTELSAHIDDREVHLLAYCLDHLSTRLAAYVRLVHQQRRDRGAAIVERLNRLGVDVSLEDVLVRADGGPLGRPHIAAAMVASGAVNDKEEAFSRFIGDRRPADVPKTRCPAGDVIAMVHELGGVVILAHPGLSVSDAIIKSLVDIGLDGVEVFHPSHQPPQIDHLTELAGRLTLLTSGGSDSHGESYGARIGDCGIGCEAVDALHERAARYA
jgi:predicted metal-dependent phosphoesterase TrpH